MFFLHGVHVFHKAYSMTFVVVIAIVKKNHILMLKYMIVHAKMCSKKRTNRKKISIFIENPIHIFIFIVKWKIRWIHISYRFLRFRSSCHLPLPLAPSVRHYSNTIFSLTIQIRLLLLARITWITYALLGLYKNDTLTRISLPSNLAIQISMLYESFQKALVFYT